MRAIVHSILKDIVWAEGKDPSKDRPFALLVEVDDYTGPTFGETGCVPIFEVTREFMWKGKNCSRTQFAIRLGWAITVHKSQGLTLLKVVMNLDRKDFTVGLSYVAVSRVKAIRGILFESPFDLERFAQRPSFLSLDRDVDHAHRALKIL